MDEQIPQINTPQPSWFQTHKVLIFILLGIIVVSIPPALFFGLKAKNKFDQVDKQFNQNQQQTAVQPVQNQTDSTNQTIVSAVAANARRVADVSMMRVVAQLYFNDHNTYPVVTGNNNIERWLDFGRLVIPTYITQMPNDVGASYDYVVSSDHKGYVLKAVLDTSDPKYAEYYYSSLSFHGIVYGVDCNQPAYCNGVVPNQ